MHLHYDPFYEDNTLNCLINKVKQQHSGTKGYLINCNVCLRATTKTQPAVSPILSHRRLVLLSSDPLCSVAPELWAKQKNVLAFLLLAYSW